MNAPTSTLLKHLGAAASVLLLAGALSACSPSSSDQAKEPERTQKTEMTTEQWQTKFNDCLLDEGVEPPKATGDGTFSLDFSDEEADRTMAANKNCQKKIGDRPTAPGEEQNKQDDERLVEVVDCLRKRGYDVPDPKKGAALDLGDAELTPEDVQTCFGS